MASHMLEQNTSVKTQKFFGLSSSVIAIVDAVTISGYPFVVRLGNKPLKFASVTQL